jgi:hypothetical protein
MPMFGVINDTLAREGGSMRGDDDFFSVARTMPFVAAARISTDQRNELDEYRGTTFDSQRSDALVDCIEGIFFTECQSLEGVSRGREAHE